MSGNCGIITCEICGEEFAYNGCQCGNDVQSEAKGWHNGNDGWYCPDHEIDECIICGHDFETEELKPYKGDVDLMICEECSAERALKEKDTISGEK